jgi:hypothetical protein
MAVLRERWPNYENDVGAMLHSYERRVLDWRVRRIFATAAAPVMRVLAIDDAADEWRDERRTWDALQADAIEAIVVNGEYPPALSRAATLLGIPFARRAASGSVESCGEHAIAAARSFPETPR